MSVDPNIDYGSHDPEDAETLSDDPREREAQLRERRTRDALATRENPLSDRDTTSARMQEVQEREGDGADAGPE